MLFNSFEFLVFFPIVLSAYLIIPHRYRWILLLIASYYFYMCWKVEYIFLIVFSTLIDYYCGLKMSAIPTMQRRRKYLILSLLTNFGLLFSFKYLTLFNETARSAFEAMHVTYSIPKVEWLLPVGISFYTFQTLSYTIDIYYGRIKPERHLGIFALYVTFFPQLVAGPIERAKRLLPQFRAKHNFDYRMVGSGLAQMLWGFFKKLVIADRVGEYVDAVYNSPDPNGLQILIASFMFYIQLYCDFAGYADIAIGAARTMGYNLMKNFRQPLMSINLQDFWSRWHISLTSWFRDYLYYAIKNNKKSKTRIYFALFMVFVATGFWHGANWTFLIFGILHGTMIVSNLILRPYIKKVKSFTGLLRHPVLHRTINIMYTFCLMSMFGLLFRSNNITQAYHIFVKLFLFLKDLVITIFDYTNSTISVRLNDFFGRFENINLFYYKSDFYLAFALGLFFLLSEFMYERFDINKGLSKLPFIIKVLLFFTGIAAVMILGKFQAINFIYFQF